ncbi:MAG: kelch repeat-containing protein [Flavobacteriales bacterium]
MKATAIFLIALGFAQFQMQGQWQPIEEMGYGRSGHAALSYVNSDGITRLIVTGGYDGNSGLASAEIFEESGETWDNLPDMNSARLDHTADVIGDQRMIIIGGWDGNATNWSTTEILEDTFGSLEFSVGPEMSVSRSYHSTAMYQPNYLLVMGGYDGFVNLSSCEKLNTTTMEFEAMASMNYGRSSFTVTRLSNGIQFLVTGGFNPDFGFQMNQCEIYDAMNNIWTPVASLNFARDNHAAILLPDGRVLVTGGRFFNGDLNLFEGMPECEIYDPQTNEWTVTQSTNGKHSYHQLFMLDGQVLLPGGTDHSGVEVDITYSNTEFFDPENETWSDGGISVPGRFQYAGGATANGIVVCGGVDNNADGGEIYYFATGVSEYASNTNLIYPTAVVAGNVVHLNDPNSEMESIYIYNASGKLVCSLGKGINQFIPDFAPGVYSLVISYSTSAPSEHTKLIVK